MTKASPVPLPIGNTRYNIYLRNHVFLSNFRVFTLLFSILPIKIITASSGHITPIVSKLTGNSMIEDITMANTQVRDKLLNILPEINIAGTETSHRPQGGIPRAFF